MAIQQTTPEEAHSLLNQGYRYLDVRSEPEFADGHPAGAVNIPVVLPDPATHQIVSNAEFLSVVAAHFPTDATIVVGCQSGGRSQRAAEIMAAAGYTHVVNMQGGFGGLRDQVGRTIVPGWSELGLPTCKDCGAENSYAGLRGKIR